MKRINDLTIAEIKRICANTHDCSSCSLFNTGTNIACLRDIGISLPPTYLEREVEIPRRLIMKKKLKDITIDKLYEYCEKQTCDTCPFSYFQYCKLNTPWMLYEGVLEQEIEIPDEPVGNSDQLEEENEQKV